MLNTNGDCCVQLMKGTLVRPVARYPGSIAGDPSLKVAANQVETTLVGKVASGDVVFRVSDTSRLVVDMLLTTPDGNPRLQEATHDRGCVLPGDCVV